MSLNCFLIFLNISLNTFFISSVLLLIMGKVGHVQIFEESGFEIIDMPVAEKHQEFALLSLK